jgi:preprotein translocase subunit SecE
MTDKIKVVVALLLVVAGIVGFYALQEAAAVLRLLVVLAGGIAAVGVYWTTSSGKRLFGFVQDSIAEAKRVSWPSRKETLQTTGVVVLFAVVMALFLWAVDTSLLLVVNKLMGRS